MHNIGDETKIDAVFKDLAFILVGCLLFAVPFVSQSLTALADVTNTSDPVPRQDDTALLENALIVQITSNDRIHLDGGSLVVNSISDLQDSISSIDTMISGKNIHYLGSRNTTNETEIKLFALLLQAGCASISFTSVAQ
jgi:hypothetical protein